MHTITQLGSDYRQSRFFSALSILNWAPTKSINNSQTKLAELMKLYNLQFTLSYATADSWTESKSNSCPVPYQHIAPLFRKIDTLYPS